MHLTDGVTWAYNEINKQLVVWSGFTAHWQSPRCADWEQLASVSGTNKVLTDDGNDWMSEFTCARVGGWVIIIQTEESHRSLSLTHALTFTHSVVNTPLQAMQAQKSFQILLAKLGTEWVNGNSLENGTSLFSRYLLFFLNSVWCNELRMLRTHTHTHPQEQIVLSLELLKHLVATTRNGSKDLW